MSLGMTLIPVALGGDSRQPVFQSRDRMRLAGEDLPAAVRRRLAEATGLIHPPEMTIDAADAVPARTEAAEALSDIDYGNWTERRPIDVARLDPGAFELWRTDPTAAPHGGESLADVRMRVDRWLTSLDARSGHLAALCPAIVAKVVVAAALDAPLSIIWRLDLLPWSMTELTQFRGRWTLRLG